MVIMHLSNKFLFLHGSGVWGLNNYTELEYIAVVFIILAEIEHVTKEVNNMVLDKVYSNPLWNAF